MNLDFLRYNLSFCIDIFFHILYNLHEIGISRNVALSSLYTNDKEVMLMVEQTLLHIIILLFSALVAVTIIAVALIIALVIITSK